MCISVMNFVVKHVIYPLQSLKSCGYVKEQFAWRHFYWYLTNEGIQYLRDFLHLPPEIVPATLRRQTRPETARPRPKGKCCCIDKCCKFEPVVFKTISFVIDVDCFAAIVYEWLSKLDVWDLLNQMDSFSALQ